MHRGITLVLVAALLLVAGTASAGMYASFRTGGVGNYGLQDMMMVHDSGLFNYNEVALGFGEEFVGELSIGYASQKATWEAEEGYPDRADDVEMDVSLLRFGVAGYYPTFETENATVLLGLRFQYLMDAASGPAMGGRSSYEYSYDLSGFSLGPVARHQWWLTDSVAIGPEIYLKYTSLTLDYEETCDGEVCYDCSEDISGLAIEYSLRLDFFFP